MRIQIFIGILLRNLFTFYATTLITLYAIQFKKQVEYGSDQRLNTKLNILNLDIIMKHQLPFAYFKKYMSLHFAS